MRVQVAIPVLSALLGTPKHLVGTNIGLVLILCHHFPVYSVRVHPWTPQLLFNYTSQKAGLVVLPVLHGQVDLLDAEPLEHAAVGTDAGDEGCDVSPILMRNIFFEICELLLVTVLGDSPGEYF